MLFLLMNEFFMDLLHVLHMYHHEYEYLYDFMEFMIFFNVMILLPKYIII